MKNKVFLLVVLSLFLTSWACGSSSGSNPLSSNEPKPSPTAEGLAGFIVGLWEWQDETGTSSHFEFTPDGIFIQSEEESGTYEVVSEYTVLINDNEYGEWTMRIQDFQGDTLTVGETGETQTYHRLEVVPNLEDAVIGLWIYKGEDNNNNYAVEFSPDGTVIAYYFGVGTYKVLGNNSIGLYSSQNPDGNFVLHIIGATNNSLTIYDGPNFTYLMTRVEENSNLKKNIVGLWHNELGEQVEFTADGRYIAHDEGIIAEYQVISNNTILLKDGEETFPMNVMNLSNDSFAAKEWGEAYTEGYEPEIWTRVLP